jgi:hypothetical protein
MKIMKTEQEIPMKSPDTAHQIIDGEAVIITPGQMMVHVLNTVGSRIWDLADGKRNIEDIAKILAEEFDVSYETALQDTAEFTGDLAQKEIMGLARDREKKEEG